MLLLECRIGSILSSTPVILHKFQALFYREIFLSLSLCSPSVGRLTEKNKRGGGGGGGANRIRFQAPLEKKYRKIGR